MSKSHLPANKAIQPAKPPPEPPAAERAGAAGSASLFPTETEIYLLPDGRVIVADLPAELAGVVSTLGSARSMENAIPDAAAQNAHAGTAGARPAPSEGSQS